MTGAFIVGWIILAIGLAIVTFGDEHDFYREGRNSKLYQKVSGTLNKFYTDQNVYAPVLISFACIAIACFGLAFIL